MKWNTSTLSDHDGNRHNNFTLLRIVFAWSVLYGHSFAIQKAQGMRDPLTALFQGSTWIGELAVNGFFSLSGFLVAASFVRRGLLDYVLSRTLRILPALIFCVFVSVFVLGPLLTSLPYVEYFSSEKTYSYLVNSLGYFNMQWNLPGVFEGNARPAVNGSLWTLTVEVRCYVLLAIVGGLGCLKNRIVASVIAIGVLLIGIYSYSDIPLLGLNPRWQRPSLFFLTGVFFYLNRDKIVLDSRLAVLALILACSSFGQNWFSYVFPVSFVYLIMFVAYRSHYLRFDETVGDISYGLYIYAWPVQQLVAYYFPDKTPYFNIIASTCLTGLLAYTSWHLIEKRMLSLKTRLLRNTPPKAAGPTTC